MGRGTVGRIGADAPEPDGQRRRGQKGAKCRAVATENASEASITSFRASQNRVIRRMPATLMATPTSRAAAASLIGGRRQFGRVGANRPRASPKVIAMRATSTPTASNTDWMRKLVRLAASSP